MKFLITGGAGFIGTKLTKRIMNSNEVIILDNFLEQIHGKDPILIEHLNVKYIKGDVRNAADWDACLSHEPDVLIHLASETGTGQSMGEISRYVSTNISGTAVMLDKINKEECTIKKVILSSSRAVYGESENIESNFNLKPLSVYGVTKLTQEQLLLSGCKIPYTILRFQNVYGDGQSLNNPYTGIISIFSNKFHNNQNVEIYDNGLPTRDFIYVEDVVDVVMLCTSDCGNGQIYNVGSGVSTKIIDITQKLRDKLGVKCDIKVTNHHRLGDVIHAVGDVSKIKEELGWECRYDIDYGLDRFVKWFKDENT